MGPRSAGNGSSTEEWARPVFEEAATRFMPDEEYEGRRRGVSWAYEPAGAASAPLPGGPGGWRYIGRFESYAFRSPTSRDRQAMLERAELAESLYEEETGRISGCNVSHPDLSSFDSERAWAFRATRWSTVCRFRPPLLSSAGSRRQPGSGPSSKGAAATNLAAEGQVPGTFG